MWKAKYDDLKAQLEELGDLRAKYDALQAQFAAMAAVATVSSEDDKKKADVSTLLSCNGENVHIKLPDLWCRMLGYSIFKMTF